MEDALSQTIMERRGNAPPGMFDSTTVSLEDALGGSGDFVFDLSIRWKSAFLGTLEDPIFPPQDHRYSSRSSGGTPRGGSRDPSFLHAGEISPPSMHSHHQPVSPSSGSSGSEDLGHPSSMHQRASSFLRRMRPRKGHPGTAHGISIPRRYTSRNSVETIDFTNDESEFIC